MAITASTLTTIAVFVPVLFIGGMSAETFKQFAYVVCSRCCVRLLVALTVVPALCAKLLRASNVGGQRARGIRQGCFVSGLAGATSTAQSSTGR